MSLDTIFADVDSGEMALTWRGLVPACEDDLVDVETLLVASEPLADPPLPGRTYHGLLETFEADPTERDRNMPPEAKAAKKATLGADGKPKAPADAVQALLAQPSGPLRGPGAGGGGKGVQRPRRDEGAGGQRQRAGSRGRGEGGRANRWIGCSRR